MDGSALFLALHALHPLVSYVRSNGTRDQRTISEGMRNLCGLELDEELEELGRQDICLVEAFMEEVTKRIKALSYLFKGIDTSFNVELSKEDKAKLNEFEDKVKDNIFCSCVCCTLRFCVLYRLRCPTQHKSRPTSLHWKGCTRC